MSQADDLRARYPGITVVDGNEVAAELAAAREQVAAAQADIDAVCEKRDQLDARIEEVATQASVLMESFRREVLADGAGPEAQALHLEMETAQATVAVYKEARMPLVEEIVRLTLIHKKVNVRLQAAIKGQAFVDRGRR